MPEIVTVIRPEDEGPEQIAGVQAIAADGMIIAGMLEELEPMPGPAVSSP